MMSSFGHLTFSQRLASLCGAVTTCAALALIVFVLLMMPRGFEFTDEGLYLNLINHAESFGLSTSQAGRLLGSLGADQMSLAGLRAANVAALSLAGFIAGLAFFNLVGLRGRFLRMEYAICLAGTVSAFLFIWLPTPNYNSVNLLGLIGLSAAVAVCEGASSKIGVVVASVLAALFLWLIFQAKPTTMAFAAVTLGCFWLTSSNVVLKAASTALAFTAFMIMGAIWAAGSISDYVDGLRAAVAWSGLLAAGQSLWPFAQMSLPNTLPAVFWSLLAVAAVGAYFEGRFFLVVPVVFSLLGLAELLNWFDVTDVRASWLGFLSFVLFLLSACPNFSRDAIRTRTFGFALWLGTLPFAYVYGSNNTLWTMSIAAVFFWFAGSVLLLANSGGTDQQRVSVRIRVLLATGVFAVVLAVEHSAETPYRQPASLRSLHDAPISKLGVRVDEARLEHLIALDNALDASGYVPGDPIIDLTGRSPGLIHYVAGTPLVAGWILGGYPGSIDFLRAGLLRTDCAQIGSAFILQETDGPRSIGEVALDTVGVDLGRHFSVVSETATIEGDGVLTILQANDPAMSTERCRAARK